MQIQQERKTNESDAYSLFVYVIRSQVTRTIILEGCEMSDIPVTWKKITRGLPKIRRHADDHAPKIEEIRKIIEYPDRRINAKFSNVESSFVVTIEKELNKRYRTLLYTLENKYCSKCSYPLVPSAYEEVKENEE
jgi:RNase P subunit RPR2